MKAPSRTAMLSCLVPAGLLLAGVIVWQTECRRRQYAGSNGHFEQQYRLPVSTLRLAQDAVKDRFRNAGRDFTEIKNPAPAPAAVKESGGLPPADAPAPVVTLQGISWTQERPVAMINGKVYLEGDPVDSFTVKEIRGRSILLRDADGKDIEIKLMETVP
ncbi:MAG: hypothetical protein WC701_02465 [Kiritimatiellales bacterium]|jgi:hypothetical protein